jgi:murein DD-endopeptidase MepM/ murein hydrolase activator NlpD
MKLILVGNELPKSYSIEFSVEVLMWLAATVAAMLGIFAVSMTMAVSRGNALDASRQHLTILEEELLYEQYKVNEFYDYADSVFLEYAKQTGELQAKTERIESLGARLAQSQGLQEIDFSVPVAPVGISDDKHGNADTMNILQTAKSLSRHLTLREQQLKAIENLLSGQQIERDSYIAGKPVIKGWLTSGYGNRFDPFTGRVAWHSGVDYASHEGADIRAVASGIVLWSGERNGYGRVVEVDHGDGLVTRYAHNKENRVTAGDVVSKGQVIAQMGSTGRSTGSHVHFEVLSNGRAVDPIQYIYRKAL